MKRIKAVALILVVTTVSLPTAGHSQRFDGKTSYLRLCASCHGTSAKGDGPVAPYLNPKPADLTNLAASNAGVFPSDRVYEAIDGRRDIRGHGTREMPVWGMAIRVSKVLYDARTRAIVDYLAALQSK